MGERAKTGATTKKARGGREERKGEKRGDSPLYKNLRGRWRPQYSPTPRTVRTRAFCCIVFNLRKLPFQGVLCQYKVNRKRNIDSLAGYLLLTLTILFSLPILTFVQ